MKGKVVFAFFCFVALRCSCPFFLLLVSKGSFLSPSLYPSIFYLFFLLGVFCILSTLVSYR